MTVANQEDPCCGLRAEVEGRGVAAGWHGCSEVQDDQSAVPGAVRPESAASHLKERAAPMPSCLGWIDARPVAVGNPQQLGNGWESPVCQSTDGDGLGGIASLRSRSVRGHLACCPPQARRTVEHDPRMDKAKVSPRNRWQRVIPTSRARHRRKGDDKGGDSHSIHGFRVDKHTSADETQQQRLSGSQD